MNGTSRAYVQDDWQRMGVKLAVTRKVQNVDESRFLAWTQPEVVTESRSAGIEPDDSVWLRLDEEDARAIYSALADFFGGAGHDTRALRKDYDAERARVDLLIKMMAPSA